VHTGSSYWLRLCGRRLLAAAVAVGLVAVPAMASAQEFTGGYTDQIASPQGADATIWNAVVYPLIHCNANPPSYSVAWVMVSAGATGTGYFQTGYGVDEQFSDCGSPHYFIQYQLPDGSRHGVTWAAGPANDTSTSYDAYDPNLDGNWCADVGSFGHLGCWADSFTTSRLEYFGEIDSDADAYTPGENADNATFTNIFYYNSSKSWVALPSDLAYCFGGSGFGCTQFAETIYGMLTASDPNFNIWDCRVTTYQCP
jgi:hypothetical protein